VRRQSITGQSELVTRRRKEILEAASKVISEKGYQQTVIADIAASLKIGHGTVYRYFNNKEDIACAAIDEVISRLSRILTDVPPGSIGALEEYREQLVIIGRRPAEVISRGVSRSGPRGRAGGLAPMGCQNMDLWSV